MSEDNERTPVETDQPATMADPAPAPPWETLRQLAAADRRARSREDLVIRGALLAAGLICAAALITQLPARHVQTWLTAMNWAVVLGVAVALVAGTGRIRRARAGRRHLSAAQAASVRRIIATTPLSLDEVAYAFAVPVTELTRALGTPTAAPRGAA